jgi:hypothetical protein
MTTTDGSRVELGASIIYCDNRLVVEMIEGDPSMKRIDPHSTTSFSDDSGMTWKTKH